MTLKEVIINCADYVDSDKIVNVVFAKKINDMFKPLSDAKVIKLTPEEMEMNLSYIEDSKCSGYKYFLEIDILQDILNDIKNLDEYKSEDKKVKRIIYYAEFDA